MEKLSTLQLLGFALSLTSPALRRRARLLLVIRMAAWLVVRLSRDLNLPMTVSPWWLGALVDARHRVSGRSRHREAYTVLSNAAIAERVFARNPLLSRWPFASDQDTGRGE